MTLTRHTTDGRVIISEDESYWTNEYGTLMRRVQQVLEDGTEIIQDLPVQESTATGHHPQASAPMEDEVNIPIVQATPVPTPYATNVPNQPYPIDVPSSPVAVVTGPPQPPRVAVVTGPPRPPPPHAYYPSSRYVYRDERTGVCKICGLSALICLSICCCCLLPIVIIPSILVPIFNDATDDDIFGVYQDDNI